MKKYIIFDLDGTLIQSSSNILSVIQKYFKDKFPHKDPERVVSFMKQSAGMPLKKQLEHIFEGENEDVQAITAEIYTLLENTSGDFFSGVPAKLKELSHSYTLFLSTGSSTSFARSKLQGENLIDCFALIYGSDTLLKGREHIKKFEDYAQEDNFFQKCIYVGDGNYDREIANQFSIDFVHIGNEGKDTFEISSVSDIDSVLSQI